MTINKLPPFYDMEWSDKDKKMSTSAMLYFDEQGQTLNDLVNNYNQNFDSGLQFPNFTTAEITAFGADTNFPLGTVWYDSDINKLKVKTGAGTIETITSS